MRFVKKVYVLAAFFMLVFVLSAQKKDVKFVEKIISGNHIFLSEKTKKTHTVFRKDSSRQVVDSASTKKSGETRIVQELGDWSSSHEEQGDDILFKSSADTINLGSIKKKAEDLWQYKTEVN